VAFVVLGWPPDGPRLRLDYRRFAYAGKFVVSSTGKAVLLGRDADGTAGVDEAATLGGCLLDEGDRERLASESTGAGRSLDAAVLAAVSFDADRTDPRTLRVRYVTVRADRRGEGLGPRLLAALLARVDARSYDRVRIGVNNAFSYEAAYKAGFGFTGEESGLAELVCEWPAPEGRSGERYRAGLERLADPDRETTAAERSFLAAREGADPPPVVDRGG
jgi:GNAT superfamily N-acetyltransferase